MSFGNTMLVVVWLALGVFGLLVGLFWLRSVESRVSGAAGGRLTGTSKDHEVRGGATGPRARRVAAEGPEPDSLAG